MHHPASQSADKELVVRLAVAHALGLGAAGQREEHRIVPAGMRALRAEAQAAEERGHRH